MNIQVHKKETFYFTVMVILSIALYITLLAGIALALFFMKEFPRGVLLVPFYIAGFGFLGSALLLGHLRGNAVRVSSKQFPDVFEILKMQAEKLELATVPVMYVMHQGGFLNAFAAKLLGRNYIIIFSEVLEAAYQEGMPVVAFIVGHELGHIKRKHVGGLKSWLIFPASFIPFLHSAYSRACEYTCDNIGYALCPEGAQKGLLILSVGKGVYKKVHIDELCLDFHESQGFATWFAEIVSTHPHLMKRIARIESLQQIQNSAHVSIRHNITAASH